MAHQTLAEADAGDKLSWLLGGVWRFIVPGTNTKFIHAHLLVARCPSASFDFDMSSLTPDPCLLSVDDTSGLARFILWIYTDSMAGLGSDPEGEYVAAFCFAQKYHLPEFEDFLSRQFSEFAPSYYGGEGDNGQTHNPTVETLRMAAHALGKGSDISKFYAEQFILSWAFRDAYTKSEFYDLVDRDPDVAKELFTLLPAVVKSAPKNHTAVFGYFCRAPVSTNPDDEDGHTDGSVAVDTEEQPAETTEPVEDTSPSLEEPESAAPVVEDGWPPPAVEDRADGPLLLKKPKSAPPAGYEYRMVRNKSKKLWQLVWRGERNRDEPSAEEPVQALEPVAEEVPAEEVLDEASAQVETGFTGDEPVEETEAYDYGAEAPTEESLEIVDDVPLAEPESAMPDDYNEPIAESSTGGHWNHLGVWRNTRDPLVGY